MSIEPTSIIKAKEAIAREDKAIFLAYLPHEADIYVNHEGWVWLHDKGELHLQAKLNERATLTIFTLSELVKAKHLPYDNGPAMASTIFGHSEYKTSRDDTPSLSYDELLKDLKDYIEKAEQPQGT